VEAFELRSGGGLRLRRLHQRELGHLRHAPLALPDHKGAGERAGRHRAGADRARELHPLEVVAHDLEELRLVQVRLAQELVEGAAVELSGELEGGDGEDVVPHRSLGGCDAHARRLGLQGALGDQALQRLRGDGAADRLVSLKRRAELALDAGELAPRGGLGLRHLDRPALQPHHGCLAEQVPHDVLDPPDGEGQDQQDEEQLRDPGAGQVAEPCDHAASRSGDRGWLPARRRPDTGVRSQEESP
jgi:hypothetical protein